MDISIVIPAYKERNKIGDDISAAGKFLKENNFRGEIIVVDDGSKDGTAETARSASATLAGGATLEVIEHESHHGKGFAVRTGILRAKGDYIMFADSGSCVPFDNVLPGLELIRQGKCDIAHGSRKLPQSRIVIPQTLFRRISSRIFSVAAVYFMGMPKISPIRSAGLRYIPGKSRKICTSNAKQTDLCSMRKYCFMRSKTGCESVNFRLNGRVTGTAGSVRVKIA
ncbi:MAG: glycosyltransferase [Candidatus Brocadiia bacterium]|nr:MAG: glycosyltransferase [Candidatus Brocadiia bacterium]